MDEVVAIFLVAPLVVVPLGYRLLDAAAPGYAPPAVARLADDRRGGRCSR